ncbi:MAG: cation diffusion facilitator family transporter [Oscillospiraceae bacterium]|nr:cation diffusion facilitator family transporter [Oscillospiraceae bacterium]
MTNLLLKLALKNKGGAETSSGRAAVGSLSGAVGITLNLILCLAKLIIGNISGSISITADALNNLSDASGSIVTLLGFKLAEKPADLDHPYGHARFEYLSGLAVSAMIILIGFELLRSSVEKIINPSSVAFSVPLGLVLGISILAKLWLAIFNKKLARLINSSALAATSSDSRNDVLATSAVLFAVIIEAITGFKVDGYVGLCVSVFILYSGIMLAKETISPLLGENASPELCKNIIEVVNSHELVLGYHDLMVHDYGPGQRFASLHVEMDVMEDPMVCHGVIDELERECLKKLGVHLVIHYDPIITGDKELDTAKKMVLDILSSFDSRLSIHDFRMVSGAEYTNLIFDIAIPYELSENDVKSYLDSKLNERGDKKYYTVITFDCEGFN